MKIKVLLLQDVRSLGHKNDLKEVPDGYARNFLIPKKLGLILDINAQKKYLLDEKKREKVLNEKILHLKTVAIELSSRIFSIKIKSGDKGEIYGSIDSQKILNLLKIENYPVIKVELEKPIKILGSVKINILLEENVKAYINLNIERDF